MLLGERQGAKGLQSCCSVCICAGKAALQLSSLTNPHCCLETSADNPRRCPKFPPSPVLGQAGQGALSHHCPGPGEGWGLSAKPQNTASFPDFPHSNPAAAFVSSSTFRSHPCSTSQPAFAGQMLQGALWMRSPVHAAQHPASSVGPQPAPRHVQPQAPHPDTTGRGGSTASPHSTLHLCSLLPAAFPPASPALLYPPQPWPKVPPAGSAPPVWGTEQPPQPQPIWSSALQAHKSLFKSSLKSEGRARLGRAL